MDIQRVEARSSTLVYSDLELQENPANLSASSLESNREDSPTFLGRARLFFSTSWQKIMNWIKSFFQFFRRREFPVEKDMTVSFFTSTPSEEDKIYHLIIDGERTDHDVRVSNKDGKLYLTAMNFPDDLHLKEMLLFILQDLEKECFHLSYVDLEGVFKLLLLRGVEIFT